MDSTTLTLTPSRARRLEEPSLLVRALGGDPVAFSEVYRRYRVPVFGFCLARLLDRAAAEDATQEVFVRLLATGDGSIRNLKGWLFTVARNVCVDVVRKGRERPDGDVAHGLAGEAPAPDAALLDSEAAGFMLLALRKLAPKYRTALVMREVHGETSADMAEALGMPSCGAVDTLVSRARDAFGVAYAQVAKLPPACRTATELVYRDSGSGIAEGERRALKAHLATCERCREEERRASTPRSLAALVPFLLRDRMPGASAAHAPFDLLTRGLPAGWDGLLGPAGERATAAFAAIVMLAALGPVAMGVAPLDGTAQPADDRSGPADTAHGSPAEDGDPVAGRGDDPWTERRMIRASGTVAPAPGPGAPGGRSVADPGAGAGSATGLRTGAPDAAGPGGTQGGGSTGAGAREGGHGAQGPSAPQAGAGSGTSGPSSGGGGSEQAPGPAAPQPPAPQPPAPGPGGTQGEQPAPGGPSSPGRQ